MALLLTNFLNLKLDVVTKFSVRRYTEEPRFIALTIHRSSPLAVFRRRAPKKDEVLLTLDQADQLAAQLAKRGHSAQPKPSREGRRRSVREEHR